MDKITYNDRGEAVDCFAYASNSAEKGTCTILIDWYNPFYKDRHCHKCPFYKEGGAVFIPTGNKEYWYIENGEIMSKIYTASPKDMRRRKEKNVYRSETDAKRALSRFKCGV